MVKLIYQGQEVEAQLFEQLVQNGFELALAECEVAKKEAMFVPDIAEARIAIVSPTKENELWKNGYSTRSAAITGTSKITDKSKKGGNKVVAYTHIPTFDSALVKSEREKGLRNGAGRMPLTKFYSILAQEGNGVQIVDYDTLMSSKSGEMTLADARKHPMLAPFMNGQIRGERYLEAFEKVWGNKIYLFHTDDFEEGSAVWRGLFVVNDDLGGNYDLSDSGRVLGLPAREQNFSTGNEGLEQLAGKGTDVGHGLVVVRKDQISENFYNALTRIE